LGADQTMVMSAAPGFAVSRRGYERTQDSYRSRVEAELASVRTAHERAVRAHVQADERLRTAQT